MSFMLSFQEEHNVFSFVVDFHTRVSLIFSSSVDGLQTTGASNLFTPKRNL